MTAAAGSGLSNTVAVTPPDGSFDTNPSDNSAIDTGLGRPEIFADVFDSGETTRWSSSVP